MRRRITIAIIAIAALAGFTGVTASAAGASVTASAPQTWLHG
jgi:uncharacterized membrane protein YtjA (UPF0391 family)